MWCYDELHLTHAILNTLQLIVTWHATCVADSIFACVMTHYVSLCTTVPSLAEGIATLSLK